MSKAELEFQKVLLEKCAEAEEKCGARTKRLVNNIEKYGAVKTAKEIIRKSNVSDGFDALEKMGRLDLSMEAIVVDSRFGELFTDDA